MRTEVLTAQDLFEKNPIYYPPEFRQPPSVRPIPAISFLTRRDSSEEKFISLIDNSVHSLCGIISPETEIIFFCAQGPFSQDTAIARHKGLWKSTSLLREIRERSTRVGPDQFLAHEREIRFYGLCAVRLHKANIAFEAMRSMTTCFGLLDDAIDVTSPRCADELFYMAFQPPTRRSLYWPSLVPALAANSRTLVRATGGFDDREVTIDLFNWPKADSPAPPGNPLR